MSVINESESEKEDEKEEKKENNQLVQAKSINQIFKFESKEIRILGTNDKPWFVTKDIAEILEYKDNKKAIDDNVENADRTIFRTINQGGLLAPL